MLEELRNICRIDGIKEEYAQEARLAAIENWIQRYVTTLTIENTLIKSNLDHQEMDFLKEHLVNQLSARILEDFSSIIVKDNKIKVIVNLFSTEYPKNKE